MLSKNYAAEQTNGREANGRAGYEYEAIEPQKFYLRRAHPREAVEAVIIIAGKETVLKLNSRIVASLARDATAFHFSDTVSWNEMWSQPYDKPERL